MSLWLLKVCQAPEGDYDIDLKGTSYDFDFHFDIIMEMSCDFRNLIILLASPVLLLGFLVNYFGPFFPLICREMIKEKKNFRGIFSDMSPWLTNICLNALIFFCLLFFLFYILFLRR